jgi:hypothetical protein
MIMGEDNQIFEQSVQVKYNLVQSGRVMKSLIL